MINSVNLANDEIEITRKISGHKSRYFMVFIFVLGNMFSEIVPPSVVVIAFLVYLAYEILIHRVIRVTFIDFSFLIFLFWIFMTNKHWDTSTLKIILSFVVGYFTLLLFENDADFAENLILKKRNIWIIIISLTPFLSLLPTSFSFSQIVSYADVLICISLIISALLFIKDINLKPINKVLLIILLLVSVALADSRSNFLTIPGSVLIPFLILHRKKINVKKILVYGFVLVLCGLILYFLLVEIKPRGFTRVIESIEKLKNGEDISNGRSYLKEIALTDFNSNKLFGIGWQNFSYKHRIWGSETYVGAKPHNLYLQVLCENGIIGSLIFFTPLFLELVKDIKYLFAVRVIDKKIGYFSVGLSIELYYLMSSAFHMTSWNVLYIFFYFIGISICQSIRRNNLL